MNQGEELQTRILVEEKVDNVLDEKIRTNLCLAFPHSAWYFKESRGWKGAFPRWNVIVFNKAQLPIAHIGVIERKISIEQKDYLIYGLQNIYVIPDYQGKGLATKMLKIVAIEAEKRRLDFGLLFCRPHVETLYLNSGWQPVSRPTIYIEDDLGHNVTRTFVHDSLYFKAGVIQFLPSGIINFNGPDW